MRPALIILLLLLSPAASLAQDSAPVPAPRIDRGDGIVSSRPEPTAGVPESGADAAAEVTGDPQPVSLSARIVEDGPIIPGGLVWRVFDTRTDTSGELALLAKSEEPTATLSLAPGEYVVHVAYGQSQASDTLSVVPGPNAKTVVLDAGGLRLNSAVAGDVMIPVELLRFDIYTSAPSEEERVLVAENVSPNDVIHLNAGVYHVVSRFGSVNAVVRSDLRVDPGQLTDAILYHRAAQVGFKLVSEEGGEAIADVDWTVKDSGGQIVMSEVGAFPATVLAEGTYTVLAKQGSSVYNRDFQAQPGQPQNIEVLTQVTDQTAPTTETSAGS